MNISQIELATAISAFAIFFFFLIFAIRWTREKRQRLMLEAELLQANAEIEKVRSINQHLWTDKSELEAKIDKLMLRLSRITSLDKECDDLLALINERKNEIELLKASYCEKKAIYDRLISEISIFEDKLDFAEMGFYSPHFDFTDSREYKDKISELRNAQKKMISSKAAVICSTNWSVNGSEAEGRTMTNRNIRLTLRAFNAECDAAIANTRWNNVNIMEKRILNARAQIDKHNKSNSISISDDYLQLKIGELYLTHEYREKLKAERDEKAEAAQLRREEQKFLRDVERAEEEEAHYQRLLEKAKNEAQGITGPKLEYFQQKIQMLERDLSIAQAKIERAQALAEKTRSGYVYIISNVGSFGSDIVKIGLTRRLDPTDRVRELGDASVPFRFDTHAIIYSDDAPALERALHTEFEAVRVNARNYRKEFFRAEIADVEAAVERLAPGSPFMKDIEAQEYRETLAKRNAALMTLDAQQNTAFPDTI